MKKLIALLICLTMFILPVIAEDVMTFTLEDAITYAVDHSPQLEALEIRVEKNKVQLEAEKINTYSAKKNNVASADMAYLRNGYNVAGVEMAIRLCEIEKEQIKNTIAYNVTSSYYDYKFKEKLLVVNTNALKITTDNKIAIDEKLSLGMVAPIDVDLMNLSLRRAEMNLEKSKRDLQLSKESFLIHLNLDMTTKVNLPDQIETQALSANLYESLSKAATTRYDISALREKKYFAQLHFIITDKVTSSNTAKYKESNSNYIDANYQYETMQKQILLSIKNIYYTILTAQDNLALSQTDYSIKEKQYEAAKIKCEIGLITNSELMDNLYQLTLSESNLETAKSTYELSIIRYGYEITTGLSIEGR